jgi:hypothetical protein
VLLCDCPCAAHGGPHQQCCRVRSLCALAAQPFPTLKHTHSLPLLPHGPYRHWFLCSEVLCRLALMSSRPRTSLLALISPPCNQTSWMLLTLANGGRGVPNHTALVPSFGLSHCWMVDGLAGCTFCVDTALNGSIHLACAIPCRNPMLPNPSSTKLWRLSTFCPPSPVTMTQVLA